MEAIESLNFFRTIYMIDMINQSPYMLTDFVGIGDYTIVEGEDDLFLYNNKKGKVYKFMIQEVDPSEATPKMKK